MATPSKGAQFIRDLSDAARRLTSGDGSRGATSTSLVTTGAADGGQIQDGKSLAPPASSAQGPDGTKAFDPPNGYFPSGRPLAPNAPDGSTTGRRWDFPSFININYQPRGEQGENFVNFSTLRAIADPTQGGLDTLRLAIETRKDQMAAQRWHIRGRKEHDDGGEPARQFETWMRRPDGVHTFQQWMRMLLEDHFVIDAPALYFSTLRGRPLFEPMDGSTLKLLITSIDGRTPLPPLPAYQQVIKGIPAQNYTIGQIGYYPYNLRSNHIYGFSRVEQVMVTASIGINRALSQLNYFTEGTVPDGFMELPKTWSLEEITRFTDWFNSEMSGQLGERRKIRFVPENAKYVPTKDAILKDAFDEWIVRVICYAFSLSPQAFVKEMNRATSDTAKETSLEEGLEPVKLWFKDVMDDVLDRSGFGDLEWQWKDEEIVDPQMKAEVIMSYYGGATGAAKPIITLDQARQMAGLQPASDEEKLELQPPAPVETPPADGAADGDGKKPEAVPPAAADAKKVVATSRGFGYDHREGLRYRDDRLASRVDDVVDKMSGLKVVESQLAEMRRAIEKITDRAPAEPIVQHVTINPPAAPDVNVDVTLPAPTRRATKLVGKKNDDGSIEFTEQTSVGENGQQ